MNPSKPALRDGLALAFTSFFPLALTVLYFIVLDSPEGDTARIAFGAGKIIQFLFPVLYVLWFEREQIQLTRPPLRWLMPGIGFGVFVGAMMFLLYFTWIRHMPGMADKTPAMIHVKLQQFQRDTPMGFLQLALFFSIPHSLLEEYYWRWFVFGWMRRYMPISVASVVSAIGFMLHHIVILGVYLPGHFWSQALPLSLCVAVGGAVWAWLYDRSQSLYAPWISHAIVDAAIMGLGYEMIHRDWQ